MVTRFKVWNWLEDQEEICMKRKTYLAQVWAGLSHFPAGWWILQVVGVRFINIVFVAIIVFVLHCSLCSTTVDQSYLSRERIDMFRNSPHTFPFKYFARILHHSRFEIQYLVSPYLDQSIYENCYFLSWRNIFEVCNNTVCWEWTQYLLWTWRNWMLRLLSFDWTLKWWKGDLV